MEQLDLFVEDTNPEYKRLAAEYSDLYKDVYGFRPRWDFPQTLEELREEYKACLALF